MVPFYPRGPGRPRTAIQCTRGDRYFIGAIACAARISRSALRSHASQTRSRRDTVARSRAPHHSVRSSRSTRAEKASKHPHLPITVSQTVHRQIAQLVLSILPPQPCVRSDRQENRPGIACEQAGWRFRAGLGPQHRCASRQPTGSAVCARSPHLKHLLCPRRLENLRAHVRSGWHKR